MIDIKHKSIQGFNQCCKTDLVEISAHNDSSLCSDEPGTWQLKMIVHSSDGSDPTIHHVEYGASKADLIKLLRSMEICVDKLMTQINEYVEHKL